MKITKIKILAFFLIIALLSCEKEFKLNLENEDKKIVANSVFNTTKTLRIEVLKSAALTSNFKVEELKNAQVSLFENGSFVESLTYQKLSADFMGRFVSTTIPTEGKRYTIKVESPDFNKIEATSSVPNKVEISTESVYYRPWGVDNITSTRFNFSFILEDPATSGNKYFMTMRLPVLYVNPTNNDTSFFDYQYAEILTGSLTETQLYTQNGLLFTDDVFNNSNHEISGTATIYSDPFGDYIPDNISEDDLFIDTLHFEINLHHLSEELYNFYSSHATKLNNENDLYSEPTPIFSNVAGGLGIFGGENITLKQVVIEY